MSSLQLWPTILAAFAASASAVAAFFSVLQQRKSHIDSIRPEIIVTEWDLDLNAKPKSLLVIKSIKNYGVGPAMRIIPILDVDKPSNLKEGPPAGFYNVEPSIVVPSNEEYHAHWNAMFSLERHGHEVGDNQYMLISDVTLEYWDFRRNRYQTKYKIMVSPNGMFGIKEVVKYLYVGPVSFYFKSGIWLRTKAKIKELISKSFTSEGVMFWIIFICVLSINVIAIIHLP